jgi:hypothetical protein
VFHQTRAGLDDALLHGSDQLSTQPDLGGISRGPVSRRLSNATMDLELAGFIYQTHRATEIVRAGQAWCVKADGRINRAKHLR